MDFAARHCGQGYLRRTPFGRRFAGDENDFTSQLLSRIKSVVYDEPEQPALDLAAFLWDQGRRPEQYDLLIAGLSETRDVISPVVIAQPALMV